MIKTGADTILVLYEREKMVSIDTEAHIIDFNGIRDVELYRQYYELHAHSDILYVGNSEFITYKMYKENIEPRNIIVLYGQNMFFDAHNIVVECGYAIAATSDGQLKTILSDEHSTFCFEYQYAANPDMWFLDQYDCVLLNGCNESSVALVRSAFPLWGGKRLVLIGNDWNGIIDELPDLPGIECYQVDIVDDDTLGSYIEDMKYLIVISGIPHNEELTRYNNGIVYFDEVMSLTYMFSDKRHLGNDDYDKKFCVVDTEISNLGLFAIYGKLSTTLRYIKARGRIPVVNITRSDRSFYSDYQGDEIWNKFFEQPEGYTYDDIKNSTDVCVTPYFYTGTVQEYIMSQCLPDITLSWPNGKYNNSVVKVIKEKQNKFLPYPDQTLGILARGTDYITTHYANHPVHASIEMICDKADEFMVDHPDIKYIYCSTEDASYIDYMRKRYGNRLYCTDQQRFSTEEGESLTQMHLQEKNRQNGFDLGMDYILSIALLAKCSSLIASGGCAGLGEAQNENGGRYHSVYVFNLGMN